MDCEGGVIDNLYIVYTFISLFEKALGREDNTSFSARMDGEELDTKFIANLNIRNHISCRRNNVGYNIPCKLCPVAYIGETGENMHTEKSPI